MKNEHRNRLSIEPISTILIPTDFSKCAERALKRALSLPLQSGANAHIVHVLNEPLSVKSRQQAHTAAADAMKATLKRAKALAKSLDLKITINGVVIPGRPFEEIVRQSRLLGAELIVIGRHGRRAVRDMFIGSTAERVIKYGDLPVLVVNSLTRRPYVRPIAAVDYGEATRGTLETLLRVVGPSVTEIGLIHAYHVPFEGLGSPTYLHGVETVSRKQYREQSTRKANEVLAQLPPWGVTWRNSLVYGDARSQILNAIKTHHADLIALSTHARSGLAHMLMGSVAAWVVAAAHCDVLVARPIRFTFEPLI